MAASRLMTSARALRMPPKPAQRLVPFPVLGSGCSVTPQLYRPPIERKLSDEQSSNRLNTILADRNSACHQPHDFALPLPMPLVGFRGVLRVGDGEVFLGADRVMAAQC